MGSQPRRASKPRKTASGPGRRTASTAPAGRTRAAASRRAPSSTPGARARAAADAGFIAFILDQLDDPSARTRAMFGGHGLYVGARFVGIVHRGRLYLKVDDATRPAYEARGMGPFRPGPGTTMRGYFEVPPEVLELPAELRRWTSRASGVE